MLTVRQERHAFFSALLESMVVPCCRLANLERERNALIFHKKGEFRILEAKEAEDEELKLALQRKAGSENMLQWQCPTTLILKGLVLQYQLHNRVENLADEWQCSTTLILV